IVLNDLSDVRKKRFHVFLRRGNEKFPVVLTYMLSEKVESFLYVRYPRLLFREFQASLLEKIRDEGLDFFFQDLLRDTRDDEVVRVAHQVDLFVLAFSRSCSRVGILLAQYALQTIQRHVGKHGRDYTSYKVANMLVEFSTSIPRTQLRPGYGDGFLGAPLHTALPSAKPSPREQGGHRGTSSTHPHHTSG